MLENFELLLRTLFSEVKINRLIFRLKHGQKPTISKEEFQKLEEHWVVMKKDGHQMNKENLLEIFGNQGINASEEDVDRIWNELEFP